MGLFKKAFKAVARIPLDVAEAIEELVEEATEPKPKKGEK